MRHFMLARGSYMLCHCDYALLVSMLMPTDIYHVTLYHLFTVFFIKIIPIEDSIAIFMYTVKKQANIFHDNTIHVLMCVCIIETETLCNVCRPPMVF